MAISRREAAIQRLCGPIVASRLRRAGVALGENVEIVGSPIVSAASQGSILIGDGSTLISNPRWTALGVSRPVILRTLLPGATIMIGAHVGMSGTTICAAKSVTVGDRVLLGADVMVVDTDFHPIDDLPRRSLPIPTPADGDEVLIGRDVFIGARSILLKGCQVGAGAVVGAGSVVVGVVPPRAVVAGSPARFVRWIDASDDPGGIRSSAGNLLSDARLSARTRHR